MVRVQFIINGEAGEIDTENSSSIFQDLFSNIKGNHLSAKQKNKDKTLKREKVVYKLVPIGGVDMHVSDFAVVLLNQHYSALQNKAKKLNKLHSIFHKKQYILMRSFALPCDVCGAQLW